MGDEIETRSIMGNDEIERAMRSVIGNDERAMRLRRDQSWVTTAPMRSILGGSVFGGDAISVGCNWSGVRSWWWCDLDGGADAGVLAAPVLGCYRFWVDQ